MNKTHLLIPFLMFWVTALLAQNPAEAVPGWGIGFIKPITAPETSTYGVDFPKSAISTYNQPGGKATGSITGKSTIEMAIVKHKENGDDEEVPTDAYREVDYEQSAMLFYAFQDEWLAVMTAPNTFRWVKAADLKAQGYSYISWIEFLLWRETTFYPEPEKGLNLRAGASTDDKVVVKMMPDKYLIKLTGKRSGNWLEAEVEYWPMHPCEGGEKPTKAYKGWFKALDDKGYPNIWFPTRGC